MSKWHSSLAWVRSWFWMPDCGGHCGWLPNCGCSGNTHCLEPEYTRRWRILCGVLVDACYRLRRTRSKVVPVGTRPKIAYISLYGTACGIATYNEMLLAELRKHADVKVFAEYATEHRDARIASDPSWVVRCWDRREHPKTKLLAEIEAFDPDIVHIGHEYGFFPAAYQFTNLVSSLRLRGYPVLTTLHSVYEHKDKVVQEAASDHVIVHTESAKAVLVDKGLNASQVSVIPHGTQILNGTPDSPKLLEPLWNTWHSEHVIYQPGFLFSYKGHMRMLEIVARLKQRFPDIHYVIQGSENPRMLAQHNLIKAAIASRAQELGLESNVTLSTGFVHEDVILNHMRTSKVVVLPYITHPQHDVRATSGMARMALGTETALVVSHVHLFDDIEGYAPRADTDEAFEHEIEQVFLGHGPNLDLRCQFLRQTSWQAVADRTAQLYRTLSG